MNVPDLQIHNRGEDPQEEDMFQLKYRFVVMYDDTNIGVKTTQLADVPLHEPGALIASLRQHNARRHLIICLNQYWLVIVQGEGWHVYNCYPSPLHPGDREGREVAALIRFKTLRDLVEGLLDFAAVPDDYTGYASVYALDMQTVPNQN